MTYLVMPYIAGGSLADMIKLLASKGQGMEQDKALLFLSQAADAIDHAHTQGMVHRDIKPANMLLRSDDWLLLTDFGVVQIVSSNDSFTEQGMIVGTPIYMAPEQARGHAEAASDMYSLAVIAYQLFVGCPPFHAETSFATIMQHMLLPPPAPRQFHPDLPDACEEVLLRGLAKQPAERYPSARTFVDELKRSLGVALSEPPPIAAQTVTNKHTTHRRAVLISVGLWWSPTDPHVLAVTMMREGEVARCIMDFVTMFDVPYGRGGAHGQVDVGTRHAIIEAKVDRVRARQYRQIYTFLNSDDVNPPDANGIRKFVILYAPGYDDAAFHHMKF